MDIKNVQLLTENLYRPIFLVTFSNGDVSQVPTAPLNRHYQEVKAWYEKQEQKPFEFDFNPAQ